MNRGTEELLRDVIRRLSQAVRNRDCPAVLALRGDRDYVLSDYDYLRDDATARSFEERAAVKIRGTGAGCWVLAVPQVLRRTDDGLVSRAVSNLPLRAGEQEALLWMSYDATDGVDYGVVAVDRGPDEAPTFAEPEIFTATLIPGEHAPGRHLLELLRE